MKRIHLNCDAGEDDEIDLPVGFQEAFKYISAANIACGAHAGSEDIIATTTRLCLKHSVQIGLHPSYDDRLNFGRVALNVSSEDLYDTVLKQLNYAAEVVMQNKGHIVHVKPHGALYNQTAKDQRQCEAVYKAIVDFNPTVSVYGLPGTYHEKLAAVHKLKFCAEGFSDRVYENSSSLRSRKLEDSCLTIEEDVFAQVDMLGSNRLITKSQGVVDQKIDTICIHGDNPNLLSLLRGLFTRFEVEKTKS